MSSDYTGYSAEKWLSDTQDFVTAKTIRASVGTNSIEDTKTIHSPYGSNASADTTTDGTYTTQSNTATDESYTISTQIIVAERIKSSEAMSSNYGLNTLTKENHGKAIARREDQMMFAAVSDRMTNLVNDGDMASATNGAGTNAIVTTKANIEEVIDLGLVKAGESDMDDDADVVLVVDPKEAAKIKQFLTGTGNNVADASLMEGFGFQGKTYGGTSVYSSNLLQKSVVLTAATNPSANDTMTVNGVVFTFKASPAAAGEVDLGGDVDTSRANLAAAINGGAGAGSAYIEISAANRKAFKTRFVSAVNDNTADTLTIKSHGTLSVSETFNAAGNIFGDVVKDILLFQRGAVHNYRLQAVGSDILADLYTFSGGLGVATSKPDNFSGVSLEVTELYGSFVWENMRGFGAILKVKA